MFDNVCKFLAEHCSEDYATGLLGRSVTLTKLSPTELSLEPIRADSLILEQSEDLVLHLEFQTEPDEKMGFRMLDYRIRVYRRFPTKTMYQVVIYLKPTKSALVYQNSFQVEETTHRYRVIRLWEEQPEEFLKSPNVIRPSTVVSVLFNFDRSCAHEWVHRLLPILEVALGYKKALPVRQLTSMKEFVEKFPFVKKVILDGTKRPVQRPQDNEKQKEHYFREEKTTY